LSADIIKLPEAGENGASKRDLIKQAIEENAEKLARAIRIFVWKAGIQSSDELNEISQEVLQETVVTALEIADRYDPDRSAHAWLVGIAVKHIQSHRRKQKRDNSRTVAIADYIKSPVEDMELSEAEMFDLLPIPQTNTDPVAINEILALVSEDDREILHLSFVGGMKAKDLAEHLGVSEGTAYMRLYRAVSRLRDAYSKLEQ
jgi:RNA polymerase sigma-70 factor (ECF subfamily)